MLLPYTTVSEFNSTVKMSTVLEIPIPSYCEVKVHRSICLELHRLMERILHVILAIESARPNYTLAMQTLCSLHSTLAKAKSVIKHCSECSKLYLAITSHKILSRCQKIRNAFELYLAQIQNAVPIPLASKISAILHDLRDIEFSLEFEEEEARKVVLSLLEKNFPDSASMEKEELEAIQDATSRLEIKSPFSFLLEKATLKRQLEQVNGTNLKEKQLLEYLLYLLIKYRKSICQIQDGSHSSKDESLNQLFEHKLVVEEAMSENQVNDSLNPKVEDL
ncbi:U-box domain-containing protein 5 [Cajanus cajan]|uniref:U-box domain-containing protein 5 n=1 Tax=Cajanus cajan TaxID=3821 RepID=UPI00098D8035|nr:U-box domain-containing protein 5 [Cajanus cajan]